jgi:hypothetical protein
MPDLILDPRSLEGLTAGVRAARLVTACATGDDTAFRAELGHIVDDIADDETRVAHLVRALSTIAAASAKTLATAHNVDVVDVVAATVLDEPS